MTNVKGRSFVYDQYAHEINSTYWSFGNAVGTFGTNSATFTATARYGSFRLSYTYRNINLIANHKYLISALIKTTTATTSVRLTLNWNGGSGERIPAWCRIFRGKDCAGRGRVNPPLKQVVLRPRLQKTQAVFRTSTPNREYPTRLQFFS